MTSPADLQDAEAIEAEFQALLEDELREAGLTVVPAAELLPIVNAAAAAKGGLFDPLTGERDKDKAKAVQADVFQKVEERYHPDAILQSALRVRKVPLSGDTASWDGTFEWGLVQSWWHAKGWRGSLPALSVVVWLVRPDGTGLYAKAGGLRLLSKIDEDGELAAVDRSQLFTEKARNAKAVHLALDELVGMTEQLRRRGGR
jgi:hypothetical protein